MVNADVSKYTFVLNYKYAFLPRDAVVKRSSICYHNSARMSHG